MSLVGAGVNLQGIVQAAAQVSLAIVVMLGGAVLLLRFLPRLPFGRALVLASSPEQTQLRVSEPSPTDLLLPGDMGTAASPLRPSGIAEIAGTRVDAITEGDYIPANTPIEVLRVEPSYVVVRRASKAEPSRG
jgi:membrane-bound serine protease (ClpP class)